MGEYFDMGIVYPNGESTNYVLTPDDDSIQPNQTPADDYDEYYTKYNFVIMRLDEMLRENNISISEHASAMYIDLAWQAVCKYLWVDYDDSAMLQRCAFAVAQLACVYYYNDRVKRETMSGKAPVTQMSVGSNSVTFGSKKIELDNFGLTADVKAALPPRKLRVL